MGDKKQEDGAFRELRVVGMIDAVEDIRLCDAETREDRQPLVVLSLRKGDDRLAMVINAADAVHLGQDLLNYAIKAQMEGKFHSFLHESEVGGPDAAKTIHSFRVWNHHDSIKREEACNTATE